MNFYKPFLSWCWISIIALFWGHADAQTQNNLAHFIQSAQANSPILNDYNNQVLSNRIDSLKLKAAYGFIVSGEGSAAYAPVIKGWGYDNALTNNQSIFAGVRVLREFISRNNLKARLESFKAGSTQILTQKNISLQTLNKQITDQYIATYGGQQQCNLSKEIIQLLNEEDVVLKKLTKMAVFKQTDYLSFKVILQQNELALQQQTTDWQNNYLLLNYLSGMVNLDFRDLESPDMGQMDTAFSFEESMYAKAFRADSLKLMNDAKVIHYDYRPKIAAFSDGGYQSSLLQTPYKNWGVSVGVAISVPIYNGRQKQLLLQQNQIALQTREKYILQTQNQYRQQILQLKNQMAQYEKMLAMADEQMNYAKTLVTANAKQLPTGDVKVVDFILSINNLLTLKGNIIQYHQALLSLKNQLKYLIIL